MEEARIKTIIEGALLAAGRAVRLEELEALFREEERPARNELREALKALQSDYESRAMELREVASGYRIQVRESVSDWVSRLWEERPTRYSRALLETLALIAYRQPITRGEIEEVRGVSVSSSIVRTIQERGWVRVVGHRDVPGRPAMFGTTREFLDYFGLKSLDELPTLAEIRDIDSVNVELDLESGDSEGTGGTEEKASSATEPAETDRASEDDETGPGQLVDDAEQGDVVDERQLGEMDDEDPFEERPYDSGDSGEELDFEESHDEESEEEDDLEAEDGEASTQGTGTEDTARREEDDDGDQRR